MDLTCKTDVVTLSGFLDLDREELKGVIKQYALAMDLDDIAFLQRYFREEEHRDPTITELRVLDTYWSDHCRHTTFLTHLTGGDIEDQAISEAFGRYLAAREEVYGERAGSRPVTLMDVAITGMKLLKKRGVLEHLDESDEVNACTVKIKVSVSGEEQDWLLLFKNETHNHPTEIEPFGGAATCLGGAIRDPLSGRAYVYQAMRVTGSGDPRTPVSETIPGKLPQRRISTVAAGGYSSYGNQIGLATGLVHEYYHPGYVSKRLEIGAVIGAAPAQNVVREEPSPGDIVLLIGGRTGRDGCGGATGSSKSHSDESLMTCGSEVQKGNAPEERKLQRLFRNPEVTRLIKRCNDFGAGGVAVAIGELATGLSIDLGMVPKKYEGLDGTELAISESQERMAVVVRPRDAQRMIDEASKENLEATVVAQVTEEPRLVMNYKGTKIVDVSRSFLDSNGAPKNTEYHIPSLPKPSVRRFSETDPVANYINMAKDLSVCSQRGLTQRFDGSIGAGSVLMPFGGRQQLTPTQVMAAKIPVLTGETDDCSVMSFGYDPYTTEQNPFLGAVCAVTESLSKLAAAGCDLKDSYLTLQEYFESMKGDPNRWGKPLSALLGALTAQEGYGIAAIGGKDSMSGSFKELDVPPTLVSFAVTMNKACNILSPEFKTPGHKVYLFSAPHREDGLPEFSGVKQMWSRVASLAREGEILSAWALTGGGIAEGILKMCFGNNTGFCYKNSLAEEALFEQSCGSILAESVGEQENAILIGTVTDDGAITLPKGQKLNTYELLQLWENALEDVFPVKTETKGSAPKISDDRRSASHPAVKTLKPVAVIPVFPGTNCEYDTARALERAGGEARIVVVRNITQKALKESVDELSSAIAGSQMIILPGGFSGGDEPDGSGKFIASFFRNERLKDAVHDLLYRRDGLMLGICNGFQALIKLGLVPYGEICDMDDSCPTLTFNTIGRHQSLYASTRISSVKSPWLSLCRPDEVYSVPLSHGEGRFVADETTLENLRQNGQIATQYSDCKGNPSMDIRFNPNGSLWAIEGITSPDGRILGKMGHTERAGEHIAKNIYGNKNQPIFLSGVSYFR